MCIRVFVFHSMGSIMFLDSECSKECSGFAVFFYFLYLGNAKYLNTSSEDNNKFANVTMQWRSNYIVS